MGNEELKSISLQQEFADLLTRFDQTSVEVDHAQVAYDSLDCETEPQEIFDGYWEILEYTQRQLHLAFDAIAQFCLDHRDRIIFSEVDKHGQDQAGSG